MNKANDIIFRCLADSDLPEKEKREVLKAVSERTKSQINILIMGAAGCGKTSTINALFNTEAAKIETSTEPKTMNITKFEFENLTLRETGLGDGLETDMRHGAGIKNLLTEKDKNGELLIDIVLVILDGSSKNMEASCELISKIIAPCLQDNTRLIVGINRADQALKGLYWNNETHKPEPELMQFLKEKEESVSKRIKKAAGITVLPVSYAAGFKEEGKLQAPSYNLSKLLLYIIGSIPETKRLNIADCLNEDKTMWARNDEMEDYDQRIDSILMEGILTALFMNRDFCQSRKGTIWDTQLIPIDSLLQ